MVHMFLSLDVEKPKLKSGTASGSLTEAELRTALVNGDWSPFDPHTVRMMIRYFLLLHSSTCLNSRVRQNV
jgi:hypothetical protein